MKKFTLLLTCLLTVTSLSAKRPLGYPKMDITSVSDLRYAQDSILTRVHFNVPGALDTRQAHHGIEIRLHRAADTTVSRLISRLEIEGRGREKYNARLQRRQGIMPPKMAWSKEVKIRRNKSEEMTLRITTPQDGEEWLQDKLIVTVRQYHSPDPKTPPFTLQEDFFEPNSYRTATL